MMYSDTDIRYALSTGDISIDPFKEENLQPASVDLTLGDQFAYVDENHLANMGYLNPMKDQSFRFTKTKVTDVNGGSFILKSRQFALAHTVENVGLSSAVCGRIEGKSSLGRLGLIVHVTAGFVDPGFKGQLTLELYNTLHVPILLYPGMPIAQIGFMQMKSRSQNAYGGDGSKYQYQTGPTLSRYYLNFLKGLVR